MFGFAGLRANLRIFSVAYPLLNKRRMNVSLYQAAAAMNGQQRWQEVIAENLAAVSIPGYRRQDVAFDSVAAGVMPAGNSSAQFVIPRAAAAISFAQGTLRPTNEKFHFGLDGPGFFALQLPNGETAYTRDGQFRLDPQGQLVNKQGYPVLTDRGPIQFDLNNQAPIIVSVTGEISQGGDVKGQLQVAEFDNPQILQPIGGSCFISGDPLVQPADAANTSVIQGYLESSNVTPIVEMASLLTAMRMFEANQKVLQNQDERMGRVITELGNPS